MAVALCVVLPYPFLFLSFFFFNDTATTEIYTLSLHDALPISTSAAARTPDRSPGPGEWWRSEEHTSELQSRPHLVCRLLLEKKKKHLCPPEHEINKRTTPKTKETHHKR